MSEERTQIEKVECSECGKMCSRKNISAHRKEHTTPSTKNSVYICKELGCGLRFESRDYLSFHHRKGHPKQPVISLKRKAEDMNCNPFEMSPPPSPPSYVHVKINPEFQNTPPTPTDFQPNNYIKFNLGDTTFFIESSDLKQYDLATLYEFFGIDVEEEDEDLVGGKGQTPTPLETGTNILEQIFPDIETFLWYLVYQQEGHNK